MERSNLQHKKMLIDKIIKILFLIVLIMTPVGLLIMIFDLGFRQYLWTTNIYLSLQAITTFLFLLRFFNRKKVVIFSLILILSSFLIEYIGVITGFPFGNYNYTEKIAPLIFGKVPVAIAFSWYIIAVNAYIVVRLTFKNVFHDLTILIVSSAFILFIDFLLEPFASFYNQFWIWEKGSIPMSNYISWWIMGFLYSLLANYLFKKEMRDLFNIHRKFFKLLPYYILMINIVQFIIIDIIYFTSSIK